MIDTLVNVNGVDWMFPQITLGLRRRNNLIGNALRRASEIELRYNLKEQDVFRLDEDREKLNEEWRQRSLDGETGKIMDGLRARIDSLAEAIQKSAVHDRFSDDTYVDAIAEFVFEALKVNHPDLTKETFEDQFDIDGLIQIYTQGYLAQKKTGKQITPAVALIFKETLKRMSPAQLQSYFNDTLGLTVSNVSDASMSSPPVMEPMSSLSEEYSVGIAPVEASR